MTLGKTIFNLLVALVVLVLLYFGYGFLTKKPAGEDAASEPGLASAGFSTGAAAVGGAADEFLITLTGLQDLKLRGDLFAHPVFKDLKESTTVLAPQEPGRPNPFAPVNFATFQSAASATSTATSSRATATSTRSTGTGGSALDTLRAN